MKTDPQVLRDRKIKAQTYGSMMRHPKLSKQFSDAMKAPVGSTIRKTVQNTLAVTGKVNQRNMPMQSMMMGGATGGAGFIGPMPQDPSLPPAPPQSKLLFGAAPTPAQNQFLSGWSAQPGGEIKPPEGTRVKPNIFAPAAPKAQPRLLGMDTLREIPGTLWDWQKRGNLMGLKALSAIGAPLAAGLSAMSAPLEALGTAATETPGFNDIPKGLVERMRDTESWQNAKALWNTGPWGKEPSSTQQASSSYSSPEAAQASAMVEARKTQTAGGSVSGNTGAQQSSSTGTAMSEIPGLQGTGAPQSGVQTGAPGTGTVSGIQTGTQTGADGDGSVSGIPSTGLSGGVPSTGTQAGYGVNAAVKAGLGPNKFATDATRSAEMMKQYAPGYLETLKQLYPGVPESELPLGAGPTGHIEALRILIKKDLNMDEQQNAIQNKIATGVGLEGDLTTFIANRDEIVNNVQDMLDDVDVKMNTVDAQSDPVLSAQYKNYKNYLTVVKGRANKRYVDFANQSITQFNQELTGMQSVYDTTMKEFEDRYNAGGTMLQEEYNHNYAMLGDLYNSIADAPMKELQMSILRSQAYTANQSTLDTGLGASGLGNFTRDEITKDADRWIKERLTDKDGNMKETLPFTDLMDLSMQEGYGNLPGLMSGYSIFLGEQLARTESDPAAYAKVLKKVEEAAPYLPAVADKAKGSVSNQILKNYDAYKEAMDNIAPRGMFGIGGRKLADENAWVDKYKGGIAEAILRGIYQTVKSSAEAGAPSQGGINSSTLISKGIDGIISKPAPEFAQDVSNYYQPQ